MQKPLHLLFVHSDQLQGTFATIRPHRLYAIKTPYKFIQTLFKSF